MKSPIFYLFMMFTIASTLLSACWLADKNHNPPTLTISPSPVQPTFTKTPSPSPTTIPTSTRTPKPTVTPTWVALSTLPPAEALAKVKELLETNGGCELPCWWGIRPGKTTWKEAYDFLQPLAWLVDIQQIPKVYPNLLFVDFYFAIDDQPTLMNSQRARFALEKDTLSIAWIQGGHDEDLVSLMKKYGVPQEVWIDIYGIPGTGPVYYMIDLFFPLLGIMAGSEQEAELIKRNGEDWVKICKNRLIHGGVRLVLWPSEKPMGYKDFFREYDETDRYRPVEDAFGISPEEFSKFFLETEGNPCLESRLNMWEE